MNTVVEAELLHFSLANRNLCMNATKVERA